MEKWRINPNSDDWWLSIGGFSSFTEAKDAGVDEYRRALAGEDTELFSEYDEPPDAFFVGREVPYKPNVCTECILDEIYNDAYNQFDEYLPEKFLNDLTADQIWRLGTSINETIKNWLIAENLMPQCYNIDSVQEVYPSWYIKK